MKNHSDQTIVNLASHEYFKAVDKKAMTHPVITAKFLNVKDGKARALMYYAKYGRGLMARWIMQNRVEILIWMDISSIRRPPPRQNSSFRANNPHRRNSENK